MNFSPFTEILDFGYPQNTDTGILKTFITQQGVKSQVNICYLITVILNIVLVLFSVMRYNFCRRKEIKKKIFVNLYHSVINPVPFGKFVVFFEYVSLDFTCHVNISKSMIYSGTTTRNCLLSLKYFHNFFNRVRRRPVRLHHRSQVKSAGGERESSIVVMSFSWTFWNLLICLCRHKVSPLLWLWLLCDFIGYGIFKL